MIGYIYKTTNLINNMIYIGQHIAAEFDSNYLGSGQLLKEAIKEFGKENFKVELICACYSIEELNKKEKYYIKFYNTIDREIGYNISFGGQDGCFTGRHHSIETIEKIRKSITEENKKRKASGWIPFANVDKHKPPKNKGKRRVFKDGIYKYILPDELNTYLKAGWVSFNQNRRKYPGLTRLEVNRKVAESLAGKKRKPRTIETKLKLHNANKGQIPLNKGLKLLHKNSEYKWVKPTEVEKYISLGWELGKFKK